jgi:ribose transport system substrate-binding protein
MKYLMGAAVVGLGLLAAPTFAADFSKVDLAVHKVGDPSQQLDIKQFCGTKKIRVALSDGWGENSWRKIVRAEFEDEASKCPNIVETRYTDGEGKPEKQIADIQGLIAQKFDIILLYPDGGQALLKVMRQAMEAGVAVAPYDIGEAPFGKIGRDYLVNTTESQVNIGRVLAEWTVKQKPKGNVIVLGGTPGNPTTAAEVQGWKPVFEKAGWTVLEGGPIDTNWDPAEAQKKMAGLIAKYPQIDAVLSDYGLGSMGALRAFVAANRKIPLWPSQDANELGCFWEDHHADNPDFQLATFSARTWITRIALRKTVAAVNGMNETEPSILNLPLIEDSTSKDPKLKVKCDRNLPPDAILSSELPPAKLAALFKK